jgi:hypothetical protein
VPQQPTKTFGLSDPMEVWVKIKFDVDRLKAARWTKELQYAALDCAIWSFHLIDWVLNAVDANTHFRLTGLSQGSRGATEGFIKTNEALLPRLRACQQIANTGKHRVLSFSPDDPNWITSHTVRFDPPFDARRPDAPMTVSARAYLRDITTGEEIPAPLFFEAVARQWEVFLKRERLFDWNWDYEPPEPE